jgi:heme-degrading monooxygenase HmoA
VSVVKINALTVPHDRFGEFERRFASREVYLVTARWRSEEDDDGDP